MIAEVKKRPKQTYYILDGQCAGPKVCPLSRVQAGTTVCIKHLSTAPELKDRLRELGLCEDQQIKVVACESTFICQVCNARFGISEKLADAILVEALPDSERRL
jgi:Fe2+ transport system protein FeoA